MREAGGGKQGEENWGRKAGEGGQGEERPRSGEAGEVSEGGEWTGGRKG